MRPEPSSFPCFAINLQDFNKAQPKEQLFLYLWHPNFLQQNLYLIPSGFVNKQTFALQHLPPWTVVAPPQNRGPKRTGRTTPQISRFEGSLSVVKISGGQRSARPKVSHGTKDSHTIHVKLYISILYLHLGSLYALMNHFNHMLHSLSSFNSYLVIGIDTHQEPCMHHTSSNGEDCPKQAHKHH